MSSISPSAEPTILREALALERKRGNSMLKTQLRPICKCMFGYDTAGVPVDVVYSTLEKTHDLIKETVRERKKYYSGSSWETAQFHSLEFGKYQPPKGAYLPVRLPFRYVEEIIMMLALVRDCTYENREKALIVWAVVRQVILHIRVRMSSGGMPKNLVDILFDGIKRFDEKQLTKVAYILYDMGEDVVKTFLKTLFTTLEESRIAASLFALSYKYLMVDKREELVKRADSTAVVRAYKFHFDTFYLSREKFMKVLEYKQPTHIIKLQAVRLIQSAYKKRYLSKKYSTMSTANKKMVTEKVKVIQRAFKQKQFRKLLEGLRTDTFEYSDVLQFLRSGASINSRDIHGMTVLMMACKHGRSRRIIKLLVDNGANINTKDKEGHTAFYYARGKSDFLKILYDKKYKNIYDSMSPTNKNIRDTKAKIIQTVFKKNQLGKKLMKVCKEQRLDIDTIRDLLNKGANVNVRDRYGKTVLMVLLRHEHNSAGRFYDVLKLLVKAGANVNARDKEGKTALMYASIYNSSIYILDLLLDSGANANARDREGKTALMLMYIHRYYSSKSTLFKKTNVNIQDINGMTALMFLCKRNNNNYTWDLRELFDQGANVDIQDKEGHTAFYYARDKPAILKILYAKRYKNIYDSMSPTNKNIRDTKAKIIQTKFKQKHIDMLFIKEGSKRIPIISKLQILLDKGANVNTKNKYGTTALIWACMRGHIHIVSYLLGVNANTNIQSKSGMTALMWASMKGHENIVKLLLNAKVKVNTYNNVHSTAMMMACKEGYLRIVHLLLAKGNVNSRDTDGMTPLLLACKYGRLNIVKLLVQHGANILSKTVSGKNVLQLSKGDVKKYIENIYIEKNYKTMSSWRLGIRTTSAILVQKTFKERLQPKIRRKKAATIIQRHVRQLPGIKVIRNKKTSATRTIQSVVRKHYATNRNSRLSKNAITLGHIPRRDAIALNGRMYHRNSIASLVAMGDTRVPHSRRLIIVGNNGGYTTV